MHYGRLVGRGGKTAILKRPTWCSTILPSGVGHPVCRGRWADRSGDRVLATGGVHLAVGCKQLGVGHRDSPAAVDVERHARGAGRVRLGGLGVEVFLHVGPGGHAVACEGKVEGALHVHQRRHGGLDAGDEFSGGRGERASVQGDERTRTYGGRGMRLSANRGKWPVRAMSARAGL